jgi:hypothetical protein
LGYMPRISSYPHYACMSHFNIILPYTSRSSKWWNVEVRGGSLYAYTAGFCMSSVQIFRDTLPTATPVVPLHAMASAQTDQNRSEGMLSSVFRLVFLGQLRFGG